VKNQAWRAYFRFAYIVSEFGKCVSPVRHDQPRNVVFIFAVHHGHRGLYNDTTNQLPRSDFCVHRDFQRITIGVRDGRTDMA
jgi:hypothetical protein